MATRTYLTSVNIHLTTTKSAEPKDGVINYSLILHFVRESRGISALGVQYPFVTLPPLRHRIRKQCSSRGTVVVKCLIFDITVVPLNGN